MTRVIAPVRTQDDVRRWSRVDPDTGCWVWLRAFNKYGYGLQRNPVSRRMDKAHRVAYELFVGPIPDGLVIDHLCRNRGCVNPAHLEAVTNAENVRRGVAHNSRKTHCPNGHPYDEANTYWWGTWRTCRTCDNARRRTGAVQRRHLDAPRGRRWLA